MKAKWGTKAFYSELSKRLWKKKRQPLAQRFWAKINKDGPIPKHRPELGKCWIWTACCSPMGYGYFSVNNRARLAPRVVWKLERGPIPKGKCILHECDNPPCCRPAHLFIGTRRDNSQDMMAKGRHKALRGGAQPNAKLTEVKVRELRAIYRHGGVTHKELAIQFAVSKGTVSHALAGRSWKHI